MRSGHILHTITRFFTLIIVFVIACVVVCDGSASEYEVTLTSQPTEEPVVTTFSIPIPTGLPETAQPTEEVVPTQEPLYGEALYQSYVDEIASEYFPDLDTAIVKALIYTESRYQPNITSSAGAVGLMQVMPNYHSWRMEKYGLTDIWEPYTNIMVGMDLLNEFYQKYENWYDVLYYYSGGSTSYPDLVMGRSAQYR